MDTALTSSSGFNMLTSLTGPIFDKELRVASRRKRYYATRSIYLTVMAILVLIVWVAQNATLGWQGTVYNISRMALVGRTVVLSVVWFQFFALHIAAILYFSSSICDEMSRGTLNVLMTTPITTLQIVMGKLLSKLLQIVLLLSLSLMTLSIVYIFGGVHWECILSTFCITLNAVLFTGCLTLFCSSRLKRSHNVIIIMVTFICVYYMVGTAIVSLIPANSGFGNAIMMTNPAMAMMEVTNPGFAGGFAGGTVFSWPMHCLLMLGLSVLLVGATTIRLRKSILNYAFETHAGKSGIWSRIWNIFSGTGYKYPIVIASIPPTKWYHNPREILLFVFLFFGYSAGYYSFYHYFKSSGGSMSIGFGYIIFRVFSLTVWLVVLLRTIVCACTAVTKEKESRSLSVLLCCPLTDAKIINGKAKKIFRSNQVPWVFFLILAALSRYLFDFIIVPQGQGHLLITFVGSLFAAFSTFSDLIFIIGFGLYVSCRSKSSTASVIAGLIGYCLWYLVRNLMMFIPGILVQYSYSLFVFSQYVQPFISFGAGMFFYCRAKRLLRIKSVG